VGRQSPTERGAENESVHTGTTTRAVKSFFDRGAQALAECNPYQRTTSPWTLTIDSLQLQQTLVVPLQTKALVDVGGVGAAAGVGAAGAVALRSILDADVAQVTVGAVASSLAVVADRTASLVDHPHSYSRHSEGEEEHHWIPLDMRELFLLGTLHHYLRLSDRGHRPTNVSLQQP
jgi:hypothetical protein